MTETPQENPFESPQTASDTARGWPSKPYWTAVIFTVLTVLILLPLVPGLSIILAIVIAPGLVRAHIRLRREYFATGNHRQNIPGSIRHAVTSRNDRTVRPLSR